MQTVRGAGEMGIAELEIARVDWASESDISGDASRIGTALTGLLAASNAEDATAAYWQLENRVVAQGELFPVAAAAVSVVMAALADPRPRYVRILLLELLIQILSGEESEETRTRYGEVRQECVLRATEGYWLLVREFSAGLAEPTWAILELIGNQARIRGVEGWAARRE